LISNAFLGKVSVMSSFSTSEAAYYFALVILHYLQNGS